MNAISIHLETDKTIEKFIKIIQPKSLTSIFVPFHLFSRRIQLPQSGFAFQTRILILLDSNLHAMLHVGHRLVGVILAWSRCRTSSCLIRRHDSPDNGHPDIRYQCITATRVIYESHRCMDGCVSDICLRRAAGICASKLCVALRFVGHYIFF